MRVLKNYVFPEDRKPRPTTYPWAEWTDGQVREATEKRDFRVTISAFRSALHKHAKAKGYELKLATRKKTNGTHAVVFQFLPAPKATSSTSTKRGRGRPASYPWHLWANGSPHLVVEGTDYTIRPDTFRTVLRNYANRKGYTLSMGKLSTTETGHRTFTFKLTPKSTRRRAARNRTTV